MRYYKIVDEPYLIAIGTGLGGIEITEEEYYLIMEIIRTHREPAPLGKMWALLDATLEYVLIDEPEPPEFEGVTEE